MKILIHKKIIALVIISFVIATANTIYCQTQQIEKPLPKKAKLKTIKYKSYGYAATGYVMDNQFVDGSKIGFYSTTTEKELIPFTIISANKTELSYPIISGIYYKKDGVSYLKSTIEQNNTWSSGNLIQGIFKISNTHDNNGLTINSKDAKELKIETADIIEYSGVYNGMNYEIPFSINKLPDDNYALKMEFKGFTLETTYTLETTIDSDYIEKNAFVVVNDIIKILKNYNSDRYEYRTFNFENLLTNSTNIKLTYKNGNVFLGKVEKDNDRYKAKVGEYKYVTGEIFTGNFSERHDWWSEKIPMGGQMQFTDGSVENGNWLQKYNVREEALTDAKTLTDKHNLAIQLYEEEQRKLQNEKIVNQQLKERKRIAEQKRYNSLTNKYGNYWGELIYKREFTPGMSKEMVLELTTEKIYKISKSIRNGNYIEIWEFDPQKLVQETIKEDGEEGAMALLAIGVYENLGMININSQFPTLVFTNDKLTDVYQN